MNALKHELKIATKYLIALGKNPVQQIRSLPQLSWPALLIIQFSLTFVSVVLSNLLTPYVISLVNIMISMVAAIVATGLVTLAFYYFFQMLYNRSLDFRRIFTLVLFAHIPFAVFHLAATFFPPADLIGIAISAILMIIGLVDNFAIPKITAIRLMIVLYSVFLIYWAINLIFTSDLRQQTLPQDLDQIERELFKSKN